MSQKSGSKKSEEKKQAEIPGFGGNKEEENKEDAGPPKSVTMPSGAYICHILIQQGKNIVLAGEDVCDPLVKVKMIDTEKQTTFKKGIAQTSIVKWDEQLFLEFEDLKEDQLKKGTIIISIWNKGYFSDTKIGQFEIPIATVYSQNDHLMEHRMLGFNLPDSADSSKITGNLAVTIHLQGPGDEGKQLSMGSDKEIYAKPPLVPLSIKKKYKQAYLRILRAENLPKMDGFNLNDLQGGGTIDAYCLIKFGDSKLRTDVYTEKADGNHEVIWMEEMMLPIEIPIKDEELPIEIWDQDILYDEKVCSVIISIKDLMKFDEDQGMGKIRSMRWLNLYGGPMGFSNGYFKWMNDNPEGASQWKGRILVEYWTEDDKFAKSKKHHLNKEEMIKEIEIKMPLNKFYIIGEIGSGIALPDSKKYTIKVLMGKYELVNQVPKQTEKQLCRWDVKFEKAIDDSYQSVFKLPDIFVYLCLDDNPIAYYREACSEFEEPNSVLKWYPFKPDFAVGQLKEGYKAGLFSMRLHVRSVTEKGVFNQSQYRNWSIGFPKRNRAWKIRAAIYQGQSLQPADESGQSDPFVEIWSPDAKAVIKTHFCEQTNNPLYYELKEFYMEFNKIQEAPPLIFNVFHKDQGFFTSNDKYMCRSIIYLKDVENLSRDNKIPYPEWFPLKYDIEDPWDEETGARLLIAFSIVDYDFNYMVPSNKIELEKKFKIADDRNGKPIFYPMPDLRIKEFACTIMVLGLRELVSNGILPIRKAFVKFNLKSLLKSEMAKAVSNLQTLPKDTGPNPNLRQTMQFEVKLPEDETFCPEMTCEAYDMIFFEGMQQPQIGSFTLKVGKTLFDQIEQDEDKIRKLQRLKLILMEIQKSLKSNQAIGERIRVAEIVSEVEPLVDSGQIIGDLDISQQLKSMINQIFTKDKSRAAFKSNTKSIVSKVKKQDPADQFESLDNHQKARKALKMLASSLRKQVELQAKKQLELKERQQAEQRAEAQKKLAEKREGFEDVLYPIYKFDERLGIDVEVEFPPDNLFLPVGYNSNPDANKKHYRRFYPYGMEKVKNDKQELVIEQTFLSEKICRAQIKKQESGGFLAGLFGVALPPVDKAPELNVVTVGTFKGVLTVGNEVETKLRKDTMNQLIASIHQDIKNIYNLDLNSTGKSFDFDTERLNPDKIESYEKMQKSLNVLHGLLRESGLGKLNLDKAISTFLYEVQLAKKLKMQFQCKTKVYILDGFNFSSRDYFSAADAFLIVRSGQVEFNERQNYQINTASPQFFKCFEFISDLPGSYVIEIHAYDYDDFFGDSLIGSTYIDVDDRFFSQGWQCLTQKPIEYRELRIPTSGLPQGVVKLWCEINETSSEASNELPLDISPEPVKEFQLQVTVWKCVDIEPMDFEGASDVYCRAFFDTAQDKFTDTHWRVFDGKCSFNWRLIIPVKSKWKNYHLTLQAWDRDIISSNELLGEFVVDLGPLFNDVLLTGKQMNMSLEYWQTWMKDKLKEDGYKSVDEIKFESREKEEEKFWIPLRRMNTKEGKIIEAGEMQITIHLVPVDHVEKFPQGEGRESPNSEPFCPEPEGRIQLSINPFAMFNQLVPPALRRKICIAICCLICLALCVYMGPQILSNLITFAITQIFSKV